MMTPAERHQHARRVLEEALARFQQEYAPVDDFVIEARIDDAEGHTVAVARYKLYVDGRIQCLEVLDEMLWPSL